MRNIYSESDIERYKILIAKKESEIAELQRKIKNYKNRIKILQKAI